MLNGAAGVPDESRDAVRSAIAALSACMATPLQTATVPVRVYLEGTPPRPAGAGVSILVDGEEAAMLRSNLGAGMILVTPGIRPAGAAAGDQKRVMTPAAAIAAGADYLVVGRPIIAAPDPKAAADAIIAEIGTATS